MCDSQQHAAAYQSTADVLTCSLIYYMLSVSCTVFCTAYSTPIVLVGLVVAHTTRCMQMLASGFSCTCVVRADAGGSLERLQQPCPYPHMRHDLPIQCPGQSGREELIYGGSCLNAAVHHHAVCTIMHDSCWGSCIYPFAFGGAVCQCCRLRAMWIPKSRAHY